MSQMGTGYHNAVNDPVLVPTNQGASERWADTLDRHASDLATALSAEPKGALTTEPAGIPVETTNLKVTKWKSTTDGLWHWVATPRNPGESDPDLAARHSAQVAAAKVDFPEAG